jgi:hypothetical protein
VRTFYRDARNVCIKMGPFAASAVIWVDSDYGMLPSGFAEVTASSVTCKKSSCKDVSLVLD